MPKAINQDSLASNESEKLGVYKSIATANKTWVGDKEEVPEVNIKEKPTIAKLEVPSTVANSTSLTVIPDKNTTTSALAEILKTNTTVADKVTDKANSTKQSIAQAKQKLKKKRRSKKHRKNK